MDRPAGTPELTRQRSTNITSIKNVRIWIWTAGRGNHYHVENGVHYVRHYENGENDDY